MELSIGSTLSYVLGGRKSSLLLFGLFQTLLLFYVVYYYSDHIWYVPLIFLGIVYLWFSWKHPLLWIGSAILLHIPLFLQRTREITATEVLVGLYVIVPVALWFYKKVFVEHAPVLISKADYFFVAFFSLCIFSILITWTNGFELSRWAREMLMYVGYLIYFPVREIIRKKKDLWVILIPFLLLAAVIAARNIIQYQTGATAARYLWEIFAARKAAQEPLFMMTIVAGVAYFLHVNRWEWKAILAAKVAVFSVALVLTFSRGYWLGTLIALAVMFFLLDTEKKRSLLLYSIVLMLISVGVLYLFLSNLAEFVLKMVTARLIRASTVIFDPALKNRIMEAQALVDEIMKSPIVGHGLGATFSFFDTILRTTNVSDYAHNAYLYLWFKLGILGLVTFLGAYFLKLRDGYRAYRNAVDPSIRALLVSILSSLVAMLFVTVTSPQFYARDSILIIALGWGIFDAVRRQPDFSEICTLKNA